jgi:hypothetical protein
LNVQLGTRQILPRRATPCGSFCRADDTAASHVLDVAAVRLVQADQIAAASSMRLALAIQLVEDSLSLMVAGPPRPAIDEIAVAPRMRS